MTEAAESEPGWLRQIPGAFSHLSPGGKALVAAVLIWAMMITGGFTVLAVTTIHASNKATAASNKATAASQVATAASKAAAVLATERAQDQAVAASQTYALCLRARAFATPLGAYFGRVGALNATQLKAYRGTLPDHCTPPSATEKAAEHGG